MKFYAILLLFVVVNGAPVKEKSEAVESYIYGVDFTEEINKNHVRCFVNQAYKMAFVRIYNGKPDEVGFKNLLTVYEDLHVQLVVVPELEGVKSPYTQVNEILSSAKNKGWEIKGVWLQVTSPLTWNKWVPKNTQFIQDFAREASAKGLNVFYYTNWYDFKIITGSSRQVRATNLWYWNVLGSGEGAQTPSNFNDFRPFGPFQRALVKQYGQGKYVCDTYVNQNAYLQSSLKSGGDDILNSVKYIGKKAT